MSKRQTHVPYYHNAAEHADNFLLEATNKTELTESGYASNPSSCSSTNESVDDDEACDSLDIPLELLTEAADLSRLCGDDALQTFEVLKLLYALSEIDDELLQRAVVLYIDLSEVHQLENDPFSFILDLQSLPCCLLILN
jgi:hypothetical protein